MMNTIRDFDLNQKRVLVRCDFNVDIGQKGEILDGYKIDRTIPTINYLLEKKAKIILMSHLGRPKGKRVESLSLKPVAKSLEKDLKRPIKFLPDCVGPKVAAAVQKMKPGEIVLLENLRFHKEEEENDPKFAQALSRLGEFYINDGFGVIHRAHASIVGVPKFLPSAMGLLLEEEVKTLSGAVEKRLPPLVAIIGGVKLETKVKLIKKLLQMADHVILGGKIAYKILRVKGLCLHGLVYKEEVLQMIRSIDIANPKLHLPIDADILLKNGTEGYFRSASLGQLRKEEEILDIGPETIKVFTDVISKAKSVIWNGPLGKFEDERFAKGSLAIAHAIIRSRAFSIVGGGDTSTLLKKYNLIKEFDFVSTGGGAMLAFLEEENLPGLQALREASQRNYK